MLAIVAWMSLKTGLPLYSAPMPERKAIAVADDPADGFSRGRVIRQGSPAWDNAFQAACQMHKDNEFCTNTPKSGVDQ